MIHDFIIIGGGIAGISAAARLAPLGSTVLLEAEPHFAYHASGRSAALFEPYYGPPPVVALSHASADYLHGEQGGVLSPRGMMIVAAADQREAFLRDATVMALHEITIDEALVHMPILNRDHVAMAGWADHAHDVDTDLLVQNFQKLARNAGASLIAGARVARIHHKDGHWQVESTAGTHSARIIVNAAGAWADQIAEMAGVEPLGLVPKRRSMARIPAPGGRDVSRWPMVFGVGESWYCKPDAGALIVSPAEADPMDPHDAWADDMVLAEGLARYEEFVTEPVTRLLASWAGLRTFAPDGVPVIGHDPRTPSFFWLAGQGGYGFQTSPAASQLAADLIAGRAPSIVADEVARLSPARFR